MPTSKLSHYVNVAKLLLEDGPKTFNQLTTLLENSDKSSLKRDLDFLIANKIITEGPIEDKSNRYAVTPTGINILRYFKIIPSTEGIKAIS